MFPDEYFDHTGIAAVETALGEYAWRRMRVRAVACRLVEVIDGDVAPGDDARVELVERALAACRWRALTGRGVAQQAAAALETWHTSRWRLDVELARLLRGDL